ncbi:MAG: tRNA (adenosine(37)-N6)-dimethylallyltransferase MiaA, partial [Ruminiclostridium sp.]|nr:tRNA (adenosine(37)-N6)-dimethylallyltransferase MiaA [Ruminiclostridium sp.]
MEKQFVVVICGPTASGKTALSVELAKELDAEIISADSMQIYKGMDIATAKPSISERDGVPHHLMDFLDPCEAFSVADYVRLAREKISDIATHGKLPMIVGGTGLYISSLINNIQFEESECDYAYREQLRQLAAEKGNGYLMDMLKEIDPETAASLHENNQSRVIRALEVYKITGKTMSQTQRESRAEPSPYEPCMIALDYDRS